MKCPSCRIGVLCLVLLPAWITVRAADEPARVPEVPVARPLVREVTDHEDFTGRTEAATRVDLRARITGYLTNRQFREGDLVKKGDLLFEVDPRPYQAQLDQAMSQVELSKATLQLARVVMARDQAVAKTTPGSVSQQQLDQDQATVDEALARVKVSMAGAEICKLNLSFCRVLAPISGQIGRCLVDPGNIVMADQTLLAVLVSQDPMYVYFDIDERTFLRLQRSRAETKVEAGKTQVAIGLADEEGFPQRGVLDFTDSQVNPDTGTIRGRAILTNKDKLMKPGMFVRVRLPLSPPHKALLISDRAIASDQGLRYVYVVDAENKVRYRRITTGSLQPDGLRVITEGLKPDDRVVGGRLAELRPGMTVQPKETETPTPKPSTPPGDSPSTRISLPVQTGSGILVETTYPGASAEIVSDTVRSPIEQQVNGLEKVRYLRSRCTNDGRYALDVAFAPGVDLRRAQTLVQNRVALAMPLLPNEVERTGVNVRRGTAGVLLIVTLSSRDGRHDRGYLGNYASTQIKDELSRLDGVGEVALLGSSERSLRIILDPDRLDALQLTASDVTRALQKENGEGMEPEKLPDLIVKAGEGRVARLRDVAAVELGAGRPRSEAFLDSKPVAALVVYQTGEVSPVKIRAALRAKLAEIRTRLPEGLELDATFDFTANLETPVGPAAPEYLLLDLDIPASSSDRSMQLLQRSEALLLRVGGVRHVLAMSENPFDLFGSCPCLLIQLTPTGDRKSSREEIIRTIRTRLSTLEGVTARLRDLSLPGSFPRCGYPIDLALYGPDAGRVREWAGKLAERLAGSKKLTDVWANTDSIPRPGQHVEINRESVFAQGVSLDDLNTTIETYASAVLVNQFNRFGRTCWVEVHAQTKSADWTRDLAKSKVRNNKGQMIPLASLVKVREVESPLALDFLDLWPMVEITANPEAGVTLEAGQKLCTTLADEVRKELSLSAEYRLTWLQGSLKGK